MTGGEDELEDITPEDSVVPVYIDPTPVEPIDEPVLVPEGPDPAAQQEAVDFLVGLGMPEALARAAVGLPPVEG